MQSILLLQREKVASYQAFLFPFHSHPKAGSSRRVQESRALPEDLAPFLAEGEPLPVVSPTLLSRRLDPVRLFLLPLAPLTVRCDFHFHLLAPA